MQLLAMGCLAVFVTAAGYAFDGVLRPLGEVPFASRALAEPYSSIGECSFNVGNRFSGTAVAGLPIPFPEHYVRGIDFIKMEFEDGYWSYLRGEWRYGGWWYYYLYAVLIKEPIGSLALGMIALIVTVLRPREYSAPWRDELVLLAPAVLVFVLVSVQTGFNHHLRYVLPAFPFLFIWASKAGRALELRHPALALSVGGCIAWTTLSSLSVFPHSLSYFNEIAGGPKNGHWHLGNSNADWGQDLFYLKEWYDKNHQARPLHLGYDLPLIDPQMIGIDWRPLPFGPTSFQAPFKHPEELGPKPGWYAVSVNQLHTRERNCEYFHDLRPVAWVGYTLPIYHITLEEANAIRRRKGLTELPPEPLRDSD